MARTRTGVQDAPWPERALRIGLRDVPDNRRSDGVKVASVEEYRPVPQLRRAVATPSWTAKGGQLATAERRQWGINTRSGHHGAMADAYARALQDGWYFTGDTGYFDAEGDLFVTGRVDDMIISGGENVSPADGRFE